MRLTGKERIAMPGKHKDKTIAFRPSGWQRSLIEQRAALSGHTKKDFLTRSCIYSKIVVVGKRENIEVIVRAVRQMQMTMEETVRQLQSGGFSLSEEAFLEMKNDVYSLAITVVDILNGAAYLFETLPDTDNEHWKKDIQLEQLKESIRKEEERLDKNV
jgi:uncharacterized protein (DUF1778 family)